MDFNLIILIFTISFLIVKSEYMNGEYSNYNPNNINIESISYELTYNNYSVIKVVIKTFDEITNEISFNGYLKSEEGKEYKLDCSNKFYDVIECYSGKNVTFDLDDKFYFYYNKTNSIYSFNEEVIFQDDKRISLLFKPEIISDKIFKDSRKITLHTDGKMVGGGVLYLTKRSKGILEQPKDGFNRYIELNNYISHAGLYGQRPQSTLAAFKEAIRRGYHMVDGDIQFTKDKIPVINHENKIDEISDGFGKIDSLTLEELKRYDFGFKFDKKYKGEKILTLESLLDLCKKNNVIIDLDLGHLDYKKYFEETDEYIRIIINLIEKYNMTDSIIFNDGHNPETVLKMKKIRNDTSVSVSNMNTKENMEMVKNRYDGSKRVIFNFGGLTSGKTIDEATVKYGISLGKRIKAAVIDDLEFANKVQNWGVNYITTNKLHPFLIHNTKEDPILLRCSPVDGDTSECEIEEDIPLRDNQYYSIYYTDNIYNLYENINKEPIGEFQYIDTNILDELYYIINKFNFEEGIINLNLSHKLNKEEKISGVVGPAYEDVAECYQYNFVCNGNGTLRVDCKIEKDDEDKVPFNGPYIIYSLDDYSYNKNRYEEKLNEHKNKIYKDIFFYSCVIIMGIIIIIISYIYYINWKNGNFYTSIRNTDNNYMPDDYLYR